jgi:hypothetical protein
MFEQIMLETHLQEDRLLHVMQMMLVGIDVCMMIVPECEEMA